MQKLLKSKKSQYFLYFVAACVLTAFLFTFWSEPINGDLGLLLELIWPSKEPAELPQQEPTCWQLTQENIKKRKAEAARLELIQESIYRKEAEDACRQINQENIRRKEAGEELKLYPTITKEIIPHLKRVQYPSEFIVKLPEGVYASPLKSLPITKFEDMHECKLPTIAGVDYVMAEDSKLFESLFKAGSETKKTELVHPAEITKSAPEKGNINVLAVDMPVEVAKYVPDLETCSGLSSLKIKDTAVSSPLFKWLGKDLREFIDPNSTQRGLFYPGSPITEYEQCNRIHYVYNAYLQQAQGFYPTKLTEKAFEDVGCRFAAHVFRFRYSNALSYDNLLAFLETTAYHAYNFKSLLCIVSECYAGGVFIPFFFLFFTIALATISQQHLGLSGTLEVALKSLAFLSIIYIMLFIHLIEAGRVYFLDIKLYSIYIPSVVNSITISLDYLTAAFVFLVVAIGFAATVYARVYLYGDPQTPDFLIKLLWFVFSMLLLVVSRNIVLLYLSWEFIGVTSMWLINFNSQRTDTFKSAIKAFTFNKVSDLCLFSGLLVGYILFKNTNIQGWLTDLEIMAPHAVNSISNPTWLGFLLLTAASIKSAQLGFHLWLPDSMDAPVPASALIHSATLVSAGVYLILRFFDILQLSGLMPLVGVLGALTSAYGGIVAGLQTDLKRALAYSTISHCGFLFTFVSLGGSSAALLYLFLHGFFKAMSFICAGEFIRVSGGYQDLNRMGSGFFQAPSLSSQFLIAMGNLCGIPFFVGYYFKSNFQNFVLASGDFNQITGVLFLTGLLCSLLYFFKVYYCVVFSFRKLNFKLLQESLKRNKNFFQHPIKSPKAVMVIFWAVMLVSLICVFWYFPHNKELLVCNITDAYTSPLSHLSSISKTPLTRHTQVNYLFVFYTLFICTIAALLFVYSSRRCGWPYLINSLFLAVSALLLSFAFFSVS